MILILDGPDGAGKTIFARSLAYIFNLDYVKAYRIADETERQYRVLEDMKMIDEGVIKNVVYDRYYYPSDLVYEPTFHKRESILRQHKEYIEKTFRENDVIFVYCTAAPSKLRERFKKTPQDDLDSEHLEHVSKLYEEFIKEATVTVIVMDTTKGAIDDNIRTLAARIVNTKINKLVMEG